MSEGEKSKGFSLRKNKASRRLGLKTVNEISSPLGAKSPYASEEGYIHGPASTPKALPAERVRATGATSDLIKKRYSVRYTQGPEFSNDTVPPVPDLPSIHKHSAKQSNGEQVALAPSQGVDLRALKDSSLQAEDYVTSVLSGASQHDIEEYQKNLQKVKNRASTDLQHNVYQNRTQFIKISKEAEKLKSEMHTLRGLMSDLTTTLEQTSFATSSMNGRRSPSLDSGATSARKRMNRSSVANLDAMRNIQLQALWKNIEGSQKFLPAVPGRHIVQESGHWVELDAATWKSRRPVHIVLLNDHMLIATKKRKRVEPSSTLNPSSAQKAPTKLVAERCWSLQGIDITDLATSAKDIRGPLRDIRDIDKAITIRHGEESFTYRSDRPSSSEKDSLLLIFRRTIDELHRSEKAEADEVGNKNKETMSYLAIRDPALSNSPGLLQSLSKANDRPEFFVDLDGKQRNLRWIESQIDELDIQIALQRVEEAVQHVEQLRRLSKGVKSNKVAQDLITLKVDERARKLADLITARLIDTHSFLTATQLHTSLLTRLSFSSLARTSYLSARSSTIHKRARQIVFEGNLQHYITQLSFIYFTLTKNTVAVYQQCFPTIMMSAVVVWAKERLDDFNKVLRRGLESVEVGGAVERECLEVARGHAEMMGEVGLEFSHLVGVGLGSAGGGEREVGTAK